MSASAFQNGAQRATGGADAKIKIPEHLLIAVLNTLLDKNPELGCTVIALRLYRRVEQNWAVARFELDPAIDMDDRSRFRAIASILITAADDFDVEWPSTLVH